VDAILDATARILIEGGYARTTTNRVAERAGVSVGSHYQYFPGREALVAAVARRHSDRLKARLEAELARASGAGLDDDVAMLLDAVDRMLRVDPPLTAVLAREVPKLGALDWKADNSRRGIAIVRTLLDRHAGEIDPSLDREAAAFVIALAVENVASAAATSQPRLLRTGRLRRELQDMILRYLRRRAVGFV
jgi:AcrR family transcriptional regulator